MSFDKAIKHGKEHRTQYRDGDSRSIDHSCRNNGSCSYCADRRQFSFRKDGEESLHQLEEYKKGRLQMESLVDAKAGQVYSVTATGHAYRIKGGNKADYEKVSFFGTATDEWRKDGEIEERKFINCYGHSYPAGNTTVWVKREQ